MRARVSRWVDLDAGHRVARHESKCRHLHGHRYRITVEVEGPVKEDDGPEHGMVIDFGRVKAALMSVHDAWDHRFLVGKDDPLLDTLVVLPGVVVLPIQPTAENLASLAARQLQDALRDLTVVSVNVQETTSCEARVGYDWS